MPTIRITQDVYSQLQLLMERSIRQKIKGKRGKALTLTIMSIAKQKFGISNSEMIQKLLDNYKK